MVFSLVFHVKISIFSRSYKKKLVASVSLLGLAMKADTLSAAIFSSLNHHCY
jgi:hypothetical protein